MVRFLTLFAAALLLAGAAAGPRAAAEESPLDSVVGVRALVPGSAQSARSLGTERLGSGVVIDAEEGLVLTIGYLVMESGSTELLLPGGRVVAARLAAYDFDSGFGLLQALAPLGLPAAELGDSAALAPRAPVLAVSRASEQAATPALVASVRDFAGWWEYLLPGALFTSPPHREFGGAALFDPQGRLVGLGSLYVGDAFDARHGGGPLVPGNMFLPIDALKPIYADLLAEGRAAGPARPWLGMSFDERGQRVVVRDLRPNGPAERAGLRQGDEILAVGGEGHQGLADFYRKLWALGEAGVEVPLSLRRGEVERQVSVTSASRYDYLRRQSSF